MRSLLGVMTSWSFFRSIPLTTKWPWGVRGKRIPSVPGGEVGDYDGTLWNTNLGVNFQAWRHVGFDLSYQYFNLDLKVDKSDWRGGAKMTYSGPVISVTVNW